MTSEFLDPETSEILDPSPLMEEISPQMGEFGESSLIGEISPEMKSRIQNFIDEGKKEIKDLEAPILLEDPYIRSLFDIFCELRENENFSEKIEKESEEFFNLQITDIKNTIDKLDGMHSKDAKLKNYRILFIANLPNKERILYPNEMSIKSVLEVYSDYVIKSHIKFTSSNSEEPFENDYKNIIKYFRGNAANVQYLYDFAILNLIKHLRDSKGLNDTEIIENLKKDKLLSYVNFVKIGIVKYRKRLNDFIRDNFLQEHNQRRDVYKNNEIYAKQRLEETRKSLNQITDISDEAEMQKKLLRDMIEEFNFSLERTQKFLEFYDDLGLNYPKNKKIIARLAKKIIANFIMHKYKEIEKTKYYYYETKQTLKDNYDQDFVEKTTEFKDSIGSLTENKKSDVEIRKIINLCCELSMRTDAEVSFVLIEDFKNNLSRMIEFSSKEDPIEHLIDFCQYPRIKQI